MLIQAGPHGLDRDPPSRTSSGWMHPRLLTLVHKHGQEIARLPRPSEVHGAHISKSDDADDACAKIGRTVSAESCARLVYSPSSSSNALASWRSAVSNPSVNQP